MSFRIKFTAQRWKTAAPGIPLVVCPVRKVRTSQGRESFGHTESGGYRGLYATGRKVPQKIYRPELWRRVRVKR